MKIKTYIVEGRLCLTVYRGDRHEFTHLNTDELRELIERLQGSLDVIEYMWPAAQNAAKRKWKRCDDERDDNG